MSNRIAQVSNKIAQESNKKKTNYSAEPWRRRGEFPARNAGNFFVKNAGSKDAHSNFLRAHCLRRRNVARHRIRLHRREPLRFRECRGKRCCISTPLHMHRAHGRRDKNAGAAITAAAGEVHETNRLRSFVSSVPCAAVSKDGTAYPRIGLASNYAFDVIGQKRRDDYRLAF